MFIDYSSLLVATGVAATAAGVTFIISWISEKTGAFFAMCGATMLGIATSIGLFLHFSVTSNPLSGLLACMTLCIALCACLGSAHRFRTRKTPLRAMATAAAALCLALAIPHFLGFDATTFIIANTTAAILLIACGIEFWRCRDENPSIIGWMVTLFVLCGMSFAACAIMLAIENPLALSGPPGNWAESLNLIISVITVTGVGALTTALTHQRQIRQHREASYTDALTGLGNRRVLFDRFGDNGLPAQTATLIFDLDHFKIINDYYGHHTGDEFLSLFAKICRQKFRQTDIIARLGGEEFIAILPDATESLAIAMAESVRIAFSKAKLHHHEQSISCTVSCGIHLTPAGEPISLDKAMRKADMALYRAKRGGRNLVILAEKDEALPGPIFPVQDMAHPNALEAEPLVEPKRARA